MLVVPFAAFFQFLISENFLDGKSIEDIFINSVGFGIITIMLWATIEEFLKYIAAHFGGISKKANDEPIDSVVYMITSALGFSALENTLFIINPLLLGYTNQAIITGNLRFIGATLLHVACSAIIGIFLSFSFKKKRDDKRVFLFFGLLTAIILHTIFNSFIIMSENFTLMGFALVWILIVAIIILLEKVKLIYLKK
jgi:RsiW-degrading membrane proteinase PrsW (M82 family)